MDSDSSKPFSRPSLGTRGCYHKAVNWNTKRGETVVKNFKVGLVWLHTGCFSNCSSRFFVPTWKKKLYKEEILMFWSPKFGVRYTGNSREQDRPRDRSLSGPSVRWLLIICGCCQKCRHPCYSYFAVVFVFGVRVAVIVFVSLLLLLMTSMTSSRHDNDKAKNDHVLIWKVVALKSKKTTFNKWLIEIISNNNMSISRHRSLSWTRNSVESKACNQACDKVV